MSIISAKASFCVSRGCIGSYSPTFARQSQHFRDLFRHRHPCPVAGGPPSPHSRISSWDPSPVSGGVRCGGSGAAGLKKETLILAPFLYSATHWK